MKATIDDLLVLLECITSEDVIQLISTEMEIIQNFVLPDEHDSVRKAVSEAIKDDYLNSIEVKSMLLSWVKKVNGNKWLGNEYKAHTIVNMDSSSSVNPTDEYRFSETKSFELVRDKFIRLLRDNATALEKHNSFESARDNLNKNFIEYSVNQFRETNRSIFQNLAAKFAEADGSLNVTNQDTHIAQYFSRCIKDAEVKLNQEKREKAEAKHLPAQAETTREKAYRISANAVHTLETGGRYVFQAIGGIGAFASAISYYLFTGVVGNLAVGAQKGFNFINDRSTQSATRIIWLYETYQKIKPIFDNSSDKEILAKLKDARLNGKDSGEIKLQIALLEVVLQDISPLEFNLKVNALISNLESRIWQHVTEPAYLWDKELRENLGQLVSILLCIEQFNREMSLKMLDASDQYQTKDAWWKIFSAIGSVLPGLLIKTAALDYLSHLFGANRHISGFIGGAILKAINSNATPPNDGVAVNEVRIKSSSENNHNTASGVLVTSGLAVEGLAMMLATRIAYLNYSSATDAYKEMIKRSEHNATNVVERSCKLIRDRLNAVDRSLAPYDSSNKDATIKEMLENKEHHKQLVASMASQLAHSPPPTGTTTAEPIATDSTETSVAANSATTNSVVAPTATPVETNSLTEHTAVAPTATSVETNSFAEHTTVTPTATSVEANSFTEHTAVAPTSISAETNSFSEHTAVAPTATSAETSSMTEHTAVAPTSISAETSSMTEHTAVAPTATSAETSSMTEHTAVAPTATSAETSCVAAPTAAATNSEEQHN